MKLRSNDIKQAIFGVSDGLTSALGVVIPLALAHKSMFVVIVGLAICAAIGMGGGEWLSNNKGNWRSAAAMAIASFAGTVIPAIPFFVLPFGTASALSCALCAATLVAISEVKADEMPRRKAYGQTFGILLFASLVTVAFSCMTGAVG